MSKKNETISGLELVVRHVEACKVRLKGEIDAGSLVIGNLKEELKQLQIKIESNWRQVSHFFTFVSG